MLLIAVQLHVFLKLVSLAVRAVFRPPSLSRLLTLMGVYSSKIIPEKPAVKPHGLSSGLAGVLMCGTILKADIPNTQFTPPHDQLQIHRILVVAFDFQHSITEYIVL